MGVRTKITKLTLCFSAMALPGGVWAEPVSITHSGGDPVGTKLALELIQEVIRHPDLSAVGEIDSGWKVVLLTVESDGSTTFSVSLVKKAPDQIFDFFVTSFVGVCGLQRVPSCAQEIVEAIEQPLSVLNANWSAPPSGAQEPLNAPDIVKNED